MSINETCIFQVKPKMSEEFEAIIEELKVFLENYDGIHSYSFMRRTHRIKDMEAIKEGAPPKELTRIVKSIKYVMYLETADESTHGSLTKILFEKFDKRISKYLVMPADKLIGKAL